MLVKYVIRTISKQNPATGRYNFPGIKNTNNINNIAATTITNFSSLCNNIDEANDTGVSPARLLAQEALKSFARRTGTRTISSQYALGNELGRGRFGRVQEATCKLTGDIVAVKTIPIAKVYDLTMLEREIDISSNINHKNCMKTIDTLVNRRYVHIITEKIEGEELFDRIVDRSDYTFTEQETAFVMHQLLEAVEYLHINNVAHRDIKPENIMFENTDSWKLSLIDFGMASEFDPNNRIGSLTGQAGSPSYVAPEVIDPGTYSNKADLWCCGVIMYILLSGSSPFAGKTADATMDLIKSGNYSMDTEEWDDVSSKAKEVIRKLLIVDPLERASATEAKSLSFFEGIDDTNKYVQDEKILNDYHKVWSGMDFTRTRSRTFA